MTTAKRAVWLTVALAVALTLILITSCNEEEAVETIEEVGVGFEADDASLQRVEGADASEAVPEAVKKVAQATRPPADLNEVAGEPNGALEQVVTTPEQRDTAEYAVAGKAAKPGSFFHDAPVVETGEYEGGLGFMDAHYYQIPVRKGQELRAIGIVQKTPYQAMNGVVNQTFGVAIYDSSLTVAALAVEVVEGNPTTPATVRAVWTAENDGIAYVAITASGNHHGRSGANIPLYGNLNPKPSPYTLRIRLSEDATGTDKVAGSLPRLEVKPGHGFEQAGELTVPVLVATDVKLGEVIFYRFKGTKGDVVQVSLAVQKPWYHISNWYTAENNRATYTLTVYDDDQVQVAQKDLVIYGNRPDAHTASITWPVELNGTAFLSVSGANTGNPIYPVNFEPYPGRLAIQVTQLFAATSTGGKGDSDDPFAGAEADK